MGSPHRKMLEEICTFYCNMKDPSSCSSSSSDCKHCKIICSYAEPPVLSIPSSPSLEDYVDPTDPSSSHHTIIATWLTIIISFLSAAFFFLLCFALYRRFLFKRRRRNISSLEEGEEDGNTQRGDFIDEDHGPMVDHPIWYIRTPGLNQSVISAITVCTYKKGEGLIDGTECSVCLSEFEDDESLRLLPKCNHAFHLTCIDTWLRSHTNCPLCRAPIVANPAAVLDSSERNFVGLDHSEEPQMEKVEIGVENNDGVIESSDGELRNRESEEERGIVNEEGEEEVGNLQARRRSVSLDSSAVEKINRILARSVVGSSSSSKRVAKSGSSSFRMKSLQIVAGASMKRSRSHSWYGRSQRKPSAPIRSF